MFFFSWGGGEGEEWNEEESGEDRAAKMNRGGKRNCFVVGKNRIYVNFNSL